MRIFHVIDSLGGSGGAEQGLVREITRFSTDLDQHVIRLFEADALSPLVTAAGIDDRWLGLTTHSAQSAWPRGISRLTSLIRSHRPDVIHTSLFAANTVGQVAGRLTRTPVVSTFTLSGDPELLRTLQPGAGSRRAGFLRRVAAMAARGRRVSFRSLTVDSAETNARLLGIPGDRVHVIPRGVPADLRPADLLSRHQLGLPEGARLVVNVGREVAQKGQPHLFRVFARLRVDHPDLHLVICGRPGETSEELSELTAELGLDGHVSRLGYTEHVHHIVAHASLFAFPSLMEGLGTALLEAMAIGTPIVAFAIPPVLEAVGEDGAVLVPLGDENAFFDESHRLLSDAGAHAAQIAGGRARVTSEFTIDEIASQVERLLRSAGGG